MGPGNNRKLGLGLLASLTHVVAHVGAAMGKVGLPPLAAPPVVACQTAESPAVPNGIGSPRVPVGALWPLRPNLRATAVVLGDRYCLQVVGVNTSPDPAKVVKMESSGDRSLVQFVGNPVDKGESSVMANLAIPGVVNWSGPKPARGSFLDSLEKPFLNGSLKPSLPLWLRASPLALVVHQAHALCKGIAFTGFVRALHGRSLTHKATCIQAAN